MEPYSELPPISEEQSLDSVIKVKWTGESRHRVHTGLHAAYEDGWMERAIGLRCLNRQKTNVVILTDEEYHAIVEEIRTFENGFDWSEADGYHPNSLSALKRVRREIIESYQA